MSPLHPIPLEDDGAPGGRSGLDSTSSARFNGAMPTFDRPGMDVPAGVRRKFTRRLTVDGVKVKVQLLPSLWIRAPFYGILVTAPGPETVHVTIRRPYARATRADFDRLVGRIRTEPCRADGCRRRFLVGEGTRQANPCGFCLRHLRLHWESEARREESGSRRREAREDAKARARGMRFKAWIWIHRDGDDVAVSRYFSRRPTPVQLGRIARARRTRLVGDWSVERI